MSRDNQRRDRDDRRKNRFPDPTSSLPENISEDDEKLAEQMEDAAYEGDVSKTPNSLLFNSQGLQPVEVTYRITIKQLKEYFLRICRSQIDDVEEVFARVNPATGDTLWFCRFANNSKHFDDGSMVHTAIGDHRSDYLSKEVKAFAQKFAMDPKSDLVRTDGGKIAMHEFAKMEKYRNDNGKKMIDKKFIFVPNVDSAGNRTNSMSMRLSWTALTKAMFDIDGKGFEAKYGKRPPKCQISVGFKYEKSREKGEFGTPYALEVKKSIQNLNGGHLAPRESFKYHDM